MQTKFMNHSEYQKSLKKLSNEELAFVAADAQQAIEAYPENPNAGYYADEVCYCGMELSRRRQAAEKKSKR
jgi:hypothetical protein